MDRPGDDSDVRKRADWLRQTDEALMELLRDEGSLTPGMGEERGVTDANYASNRLSLLADYGLVERAARGLYRLTDDGEAFLEEELDASELERDG